MKIKWWIEDGYVGKRLFYTHIPDSDIFACETEEEIKGLIEEHVKFTFEERISYGWDMEEALSKALGIRVKAVELDK